jgi:hypothetical protein
VRSTLNRHGVYGVVGQRRCDATAVHQYRCIDSCRFSDGSGCAARGPMLRAENATLNGNNIDKNGPIRSISDLSHISLACLFIKFSVL